MRHWLLAFGPDGAKIIRQAELIAQRLRRGSGIITVGASKHHIDDLPANSVMIVRLYSVEEKIFEFSEETLTEVVFDFYNSAHAKDCAVITRDLRLKLPEGVEAGKVERLVVELEPDDQVTRQIRWSVDHYYPTLTAKKLSGKKFI